MVKNTLVHYYAQKNKDGDVKLFYVSDVIMDEVRVSEYEAVILDPNNLIDKAEMWDRFVVSDIIVEDGVKKVELLGIEKNKHMSDFLLLEE